MGAFGFAADLSLKRRGGGGDGLASLFANGERGAWYDPSDLATMYQDSDGTVPAALNSPVGFLGDKSGRGSHMVQTLPAARPILRQDSGGRHYLEYEVDKDLTFGGPLVPVTGSATTFVALRNHLTVTNAYALGGDSDNGILLLYNGTTGQLRAAVSYSGGTFTAGNSTLSVTPTQNHIYRHIWDRASMRVKAHLNGVEAISLTGSNLDLSKPARTGLGSRGGGPPKLTGRIYGAVAVSRLLSPAETARVESFLAARAGVTPGG